MDLRKRVGTMVAVYRRRRSLTQQQLADRIGMSPDMVSRIETGGTGLRFPTIEKISSALEIDPAQLFSISDQAPADFRPALTKLMVRLAALPDRELDWLTGIIDSALDSHRR